MNTKNYIEIEEQYGAHNYHPLDVVVQDAEGVWVTDVEGKKYMDCLAAYSAVNQGHCHPKIYEVFAEQAKHVTLTSRAFRNDKLPLLYKKLHDMTGYDMSLPMNSGAEAVETAIKTARRWGYDVKGIEKDKAEIVVATGNFHGRTTTIVGFSDDPSSFGGFGPFTPGFVFHEYGNVEDLKSKINENTCAVMIEPIQGEGGIVIPPEGYLKAVEQVCKENNILFICDEIQAGLGRSGKLFAHYYENVRPDIVIIGKALSGGYYPVSAILADKDVLGVIKPGEHGSTFGGNPLAAAVAVRSLEVLEEENLIEHSFETGNYFIEKLRAIDSPHIVEVRGRGLWIGFVLDRKARPYCEKLMDEGLLAKETHENIIRFAPPLVITRDEVDWAVEKIEKVVKELDKEEF
jgi:ornithine--oxo-acid transaminase